MKKPSDIAIIVEAIKQFTTKIFRVLKDVAMLRNVTTENGAQRMQTEKTDLKIKQSSYIGKMIDKFRMEELNRMSVFAESSRKKKKQILHNLGQKWLRCDSLHVMNPSPTPAIVPPPLTEIDTTDLEPT